MRANTAGMERAPSTTSAHQPLPLCRYPLVSTYNSTAVSRVLTLTRCTRARTRCNCLANTWAYSSDLGMQPLDRMAACCYVARPLAVRLVQHSCWRCASSVDVSDLLQRLLACVQWTNYIGETTLPVRLPATLPGPACCKGVNRMNDVPGHQRNEREKRPAQLLPVRHHPRRCSPPRSAKAAARLLTATPPLAAVARPPAPTCLRVRGGDLFDLVGIPHDVCPGRARGISSPVLPHSMFSSANARDCCATS